MTPRIDELDDFERRLAETIAARGADLHRDLATLVAMPTGLNHTPGLDEARAWFEARLAALGADCTLVPGDPRPGWLEVRQAQDDPAAEDAEATAIPPTLVATRRAAKG